VIVRSRQHGVAVRGSVDVSSAGAGSRLDAVLLAKRATLASAHSSSVRVGGIARTAVGPGKVAFKVPLKAGRARRALARNGRLALVLRLTLTPQAGGAVIVTRNVVLHR
jgi:hypothetical protein